MNENTTTPSTIPRIERRPEVPNGPPSWPEGEPVSEVMNEDLVVVLLEIDRVDIVVVVMVMVTCGDSCRFPFL